MMRWVLWGVTLLLFGLLVVPAGSAKTPAKSKGKKAHTELAAGPSPSTPSPDTAAGAGEASPATAEAAVALPAQNPASKTKKDRRTSAADQPTPKFTPMLATTGTLGLFTLDTGDTLPKGGFSFSAYGNKVQRMPGSVAVFTLGLNAAVGLTDRLTLYGVFEPYGHTHIGNPRQLSLDTPTNDPIDFAPFPAGNPTIYRTIGPGFAAAYVEDFPFASSNEGGVGQGTLGLKFGLLSERLGDPFSLSIRNDIILPTVVSLHRLINNGVNFGQLQDQISLSISKKFSNLMIPTFDAGYRITGDPNENSQDLFTAADQFRVGAGFLMLPESRIEPMVEYNAIVFTGSHTPNTTFGARDPVDGIWGLRLYFTRDIALDLGYRYMLNLRDAHDRHGFVIKLGTGIWPKKAPPVNHPPTASCAIDKPMVFVDSGDTVTVTAMASDPDGDPLTYTWSANGGRIDGSGPQVRWLSAGTAIGTYTITVHVDDGRGGVASCSSEVRVDPRPNRPPTISCSADRTSVFAGERVHITANASDPDGDPLTYTWSANAGRIVGSGAAVDFDTTGLAPGTYTVTGRVDDGRGGAADCSTAIEVKAVPPPPQASKISECSFARPLSARIDNVCKRILDDVALRLQNEPRATAVIIGYSDPKERRPEKLAGDRAANAVKYLGEKGIDASRVQTRTGGGQAGAGQQNRRIEVIWVPEGATY